MGESANNSFRVTNEEKEIKQYYFEEWKISRETVGKFDDILKDLRKYGFTLLTGILTAGSFLGFSGTTIIAQVAVIIVTMVLVVVLYWLDCYYQSLLFGAVFRTRFLEIFRVNGGLTTYISAFHGASKMIKILHFLYFGFLLGALVLGLFVSSTLVNTFSGSNENANNLLNISKLDKVFTKFNMNYTYINNVINSSVIKRSPSFIEQNLNYIPIGSFLASSLGIILIHFGCNKGRNNVVKDVSLLFKKHMNSKDPDILNLEKNLQKIFDEYT